MLENDPLKPKVDPFLYTPLSENNYPLFVQKEYSEWKVWLVGNFVLKPFKGEEPNRFNRFMQRLCFGFRWEKDK